MGRREREGGGAEAAQATPTRLVKERWDDVIRFAAADASSFVTG